MTILLGDHEIVFYHLNKTFAKTNFLINNIFYLCKVSHRYQVTFITLFTWNVVMVTISWYFVEEGNEKSLISNRSSAWPTLISCCIYFKQVADLLFIKKVEYLWLSHIKYWLHYNINPTVLFWFKDLSCFVNFSLACILRGGRRRLEYLSMNLLEPISLSSIL